MVFSKFERIIAWRYLRPKGGEGFISVIALFSFLGILLGVATLIIVMSVMNGFRAELFDNILKFNGHVHVQSTKRGQLDLGALKGQLQATDPSIQQITQILEGQAMAIFPASQSRGLMVRGIKTEDLKAQSLIAENISNGSLDNLADFNTIVIGDALAAYAGLRVGDTLKLIAPTATATAFGFMPRFKEFKVGAIFTSGNWNYDLSYAFIPYDTAEKLFDKAVPELEIFLKSPHLVDGAITKIYRATNWQATVKDWRQANRAFFDAIMVERNVMFIILTLIILIAAFNIISSMIMLVRDKTKAIAILRTMGAKRASIMRIFFLTGSSIGIAGTFIGLGLGLLFCHYIESIRQFMQSLTGVKLFQEEIYFLSKLPAIVNPLEVSAVAGVALGLTFLATLYPSYKAARLDPVEALRYE